MEADEADSSSDEDVPPVEARPVLKVTSAEDVECTAQPILDLVPKDPADSAVGTPDIESILKKKVKVLIPKLKAKLIPKRYQPVRGTKKERKRVSFDV